MHYINCLWFLIPESSPIGAKSSALVRFYILPSKTFFILFSKTVSDPSVFFSSSQWVCCKYEAWMMTREYSRSTHTDRLHQLEKENICFCFFSFFLFSLSMIHSHRMQTARGGGLRGVLSKQQNKKREHKIFIMMSGVKGGVHQLRRRKRHRWLISGRLSKQNIKYKIHFVLNIQ